MRCAGCGHENRASARFCDNCGGRLAPVCPWCGQQPRPGARSCDGCGQPVGGATAGSPTAAPDPASYRPTHPAERILAARADLTGERKQVTVLFADVVGSTELIQGLDPEEADALLRPVVQAMVDGIHRYEGTVNRVQGDGVMALFGAPLAHEDHAVRACYAALAIQEAVRRPAERCSGSP